MKRTTLHFTIDGLLALGIVGLILTGVLIEYVLPTGSGRASVWGLTRHQWGDVHAVFAMALLVLALIHLALHWGWVCSVCAKFLELESTRPTLRRQLVSGLAAAATLCVIVFGFFAAASAFKVEDPRWGMEAQDQELWREVDQLWAEPLGQ